jgi:hypothetical protein
MFCPSAIAGCVAVNRPAGGWAGFGICRPSVGMVSIAAAMPIAERLLSESTNWKSRT